MTSATDIIGYTYAAENWTSQGIIEAGIRDGWLAPAARDMDVEEVLDQAQHYFPIDRMDETTFDSGEFPKVIFRYQVEDDELLLDENREYVRVGDL